MTKILDEVELMFEKTPVRKSVSKKPFKTRLGGISEASSWQLAKELVKRHYVDLQVLGFWLLVAVLIWIKLG